MFKCHFKFILLPEMQSGQLFKINRLIFNNQIKNGNFFSRKKKKKRKLQTSVCIEMSTLSCVTIPKSTERTPLGS